MLSPSNSCNNVEGVSSSVLRDNERSQEDKVPPSVSPLPLPGTVESDGNDEGEVYFTGGDADAMASIESSSSGNNNVPLTTIQCSNQSRNIRELPSCE